MYVRAGVYACVMRVYVMRVRADNTSGGKSQENFAEKLFKIFVDTLCEILYHVLRSLM